MTRTPTAFDAHAERSRLSTMATSELRQLYRALSGDEARSQIYDWAA